MPLEMLESGHHPILAVWTIKASSRRNIAPTTQREDISGEGEKCPRTGARTSQPKNWE